MRARRGIILPQRHREHGDEEILKILKRDPKMCFYFFSSDFVPKLRVLCVSVVNNSPPCPPSPLCALL
jgi:hypothetical protein